VKARTQLDFDIHGPAGVRLIDPSPEDAAGARLELGLLERPSGLVGEPDLTVRYVDRIRHATPPRHLGRNDAAFADDAFLVVGSRQGLSAEAVLPLTDIGGRCVSTARGALARSLCSCRSST
jgi:hypothetical protein